MEINMTETRNDAHVDPFVGNYPCPESPSGYCKHGGNKVYNYGFVRGTAKYCRKIKMWVHDLDVCPIQ